MSLLWNGIFKKKPSPTCQRNAADSARNPGSYRKGLQPFVLKRFIEGISLRTSLSKSCPAGMTVEAAIVLPLFLFFFLNLGCALEMIRLHGNLQLALWQAGTKLSVYGYAVDSGQQPQEEQDGGWWKELAGAAVSGTMVKNQIVKDAGKNYLDQSPLSGGAQGLRLWESKVFGDNGEMDIVVTYSVSPWIGLMDFGSFRMANRYYSHIWNGYQLSGGSMGGNPEDGLTVYVTETGTVYHKSLDCTYLKLSVKPVSASEVEGERNQNGGKYYPCSKCAKGTEPAILFITGEGDRYHYDKECSGLKRTVSSMLLKEAVEAGYHGCSRCGH